MPTQLKPYDQVVYLLQGGGALGSYQAGVCEALLTHKYEPDWIVGTSIGAINAAIIAGNKPEDRVPMLKKFWECVTYPFFDMTDIQKGDLWHELINYMNASWIALTGQPNFFKPRLFNPMFLSSCTPDQISFYDTSDMRETLLGAINFDLINKGKIRLTLGAVNVKGGKAVRFDNMHCKIIPEHIMASCALPPAFPAVKIDDEYYWDGGLSSNTPFAVVMEEKIPQKLLCFIINLFSYPDRLPTSMMDVIKFKKELEYTSRHQEVLRNFCELHYLQNAISQMAKTILDNNDLNSALKRIKEIGHPTALNIIHFHYHDVHSNLWSKDYDFAKQAIQEHWQAGHQDAMKVLRKPEMINTFKEDVCTAMHDV